MIINLLVIVTILLSALLWGSRQRGRGLFSALVHLVCVVAAGGVAFAAWEPLVYGFLLKTAENYAWCLGLLVPFLVTLVIFRVIADMTVTKNLDFNDATNFAGGAVFGGLAGLVTAGILVLSLSNVRTGRELLGYTPVTFEGGSMVSTRSLWVPADKIVVGMYEKLSIGSFGTSTPLAERSPKVWEQAAMMRTSLQGGVGDGKNIIGRVGVLPEDVTIAGRYRVGPMPADKLLTDSFVVGADGKGIRQQFVYADGSAPSGEPRIEAFVLNFTSGAGEKSGQVVLGPGQLRLVCKTESGAVGIHPAAIVAKPEAGAGMYRFRMDAPDIFIPSVGGGSNAVFAAEFIVPQGYTPTDLIIKNTRFELDQLDATKVQEFASTEKRDDAVRTGAVFARFGMGGTPAAGGTATSGTSSSSGGTSTSATSSSGVQVLRPNASGDRFLEASVSDILPDNYMIDSGEIGGLELNGEKSIVNGEHQFERERLTNNRGLDKNLRVDRFASTRDTAIVQVLLADKGTMSVLGRAVESAEDILPPVLIDQSGQRYEAVGYVYAEGSIVRIRYTPGKPIRGLSELPSRISRSKRDQTVRLLFRPTSNVSITAFALGSKTLAEFQPPLTTTR